MGTVPVFDRTSDVGFVGADPCVCPRFDEFLSVYYLPTFGSNPRANTRVRPYRVRAYWKGLILFAE